MMNGRCFFHSDACWASHLPDPLSLLLKCTGLECGGVTEGCDEEIVSLGMPPSAFQSGFGKAWTTTYGLPALRCEDLLPLIEGFASQRSFQPLLLPVRERK
eukprot:252245-Alexandrium_andersonii.AAC.1